MKRKTKDFLTVFSSIILTAAILYTAILAFRYAQLHGGLTQIPAQTAVDHLLRVFPVFFILFVILTVLVADRSNRTRDEGVSAQVERSGMHVYSFDIPKREAMAEKPQSDREQYQGVAVSEKREDPYASSLSSDELDFFEQNEEEERREVQQATDEPEVASVQMAREPAEEVIFDDKYEPPRYSAPDASESIPKPRAEPTPKRDSGPSSSQQPDKPKQSDSSKEAGVSARSNNLPAFDGEDDFYKRLAQEVDFSNEKRYEVSLLLINLEPEKFSSDFLVFKEATSSFFQETSFIFEYTHEHSFAVILPFFSFSDAQKELVRFYTSLKDELTQRSTIFRAGFSSKFNRIIDSETLLYETEVAFKKALEDTGFCILGFEPDVNKYDQYYWSS